MVYDLSNVLLDSVCKYFVEDFCMYVHQNIPMSFFFWCISTWFWHEGNTGFIEWLW
jgi:hypothetical protein